MEGEPSKAFLDMRSKLIPGLMATWSVWPIANFVGAPMAWSLHLAVMRRACRSIPLCNHICKP